MFYKFKSFTTMNKKFIVMAAFAAVFGMGFTACSNNDDLADNGGGTPSSIKRGITFNLASENQPVTRGAVVTTAAQIQADAYQFKVWAFDATTDGMFMGGSASTGLNVNWNTALDPAAWDYRTASIPYYYWPSNNLSFVAITPQSNAEISAVNAACTSDNVTLATTVSVPTTVANQMDVMVASYKDINYKGTNDAVNLTFRHALSQVAFAGRIEKSSNIEYVRVNSIQIKNIRPEGTITYTAASAGGDANSFVSVPNTEVAVTDYNATLVFDDAQSYETINSDYKTSDVANTNYKPLTSDDAQLMLLPQAVNGWTPTGTNPDGSDVHSYTTEAAVGVAATGEAAETANKDKVYLIVNAKLFGANDVELFSGDVYIPFPASHTWAPETKYLYNLEFTDDLLTPIKFTVATPAAWSTPTQTEYKF